MVRADCSDIHYLFDEDDEPKLIWVCWELDTYEWGDGSIQREFSLINAGSYATGREIPIDSLDEDKVYSILENEGVF